MRSIIIFVEDVMRFIFLLFHVQVKETAEATDYIHLVTKSASIFVSPMIKDGDNEKTGLVR